MEKPSTLGVALLGILTVNAAFAVWTWMVYEQGQVGISLLASPAAASGSPAAAQTASAKEFTMVCEVTLTLPVKGFDAPAMGYTELLLGGVNLNNKTGWYQGQFALSDTRKGTLTQERGKITVSRPALFERYGAMITGEQFTLKRSNGEFVQSLSLQDGRKYELIKGYCGKLIKAPL